MKPLYKSSKNKMICGVCGGVAEYFGIDPTLVRLAFLACVIFLGTGILAYIVAAVVIPEAPAAACGTTALATVEKAEKTAETEEQRAEASAF